MATPIVNAGHDGYANTPYRAYLLSPEASSVLVMPGVPFRPAAATTLVSCDIQQKAQSYEFHDTAFGGLPRWRSVYVDQNPDLILVFDRASGAGSYEQLWHLDPSLSVSSVTAARRQVAELPSHRRWRDRAELDLNDHLSERVAVTRSCRGSRR